MSAPNDAKPIGKENPSWLDCHWKVTCECGWRGEVHQLLGVEGEDNTMWCPQCKTAGYWCYD